METDAQTETSSENNRSENTPRIYVASLADYNAGRLLGRWIDADQPADAIHDAIMRMLEQSSELIAEDWAIHDYENFGSLSLREFESLESVSAVACGIVEHGPVFAGLVTHFGGAGNVEEAKGYMEDGYRGEFDSLSDYAADLIHECYGDVLKNVPDFILGHLDYDGIGRDLELGGDIFTVECEGRVHVFDSQL